MNQLHLVLLILTAFIGPVVLSINLECYQCGTQGRVEDGDRCREWNLVKNEAKGVFENITNTNITKTKCYYDYGQCYSFYLHYLFTYPPVTLNRTLNCTWDNKECNNITDISFLSGVQLLKNGTFNYTKPEDDLVHVWKYMNESYEYIQPPVEYKMFQKGCTDLQKSWCYDKNITVKNTNGDDVRVEPETWQIDVVNLRGVKLAYVDCQYYTCNSTLKNYPYLPCNNRRNGKHMLSGSTRGWIYSYQVWSVVVVSIATVSGAYTRRC